MTTELHDTDLLAAIDRENAKPNALDRDQGLIAWAQGILDDRKNPGARQRERPTPQHECLSQEVHRPCAEAEGELIWASSTG